MITNKYSIPIMFIIGLVLFNVYTYNMADDTSIIPIIIASTFIGVYKGLIADESKEVFNLYRVKGLFKGSLRALEMIVAILIVISTNHASYKLLSVMSFGNIIFEIIYHVVFFFIIYRFLIFNIFKDKR